jgi:predicted amidohydrolase
MRLAAFQMIAREGDVDANLALIDAAAAEAKAEGADILVAPELATTGYGAGDAIRALAEPADGAQAARLSAIAEQHGMAIVAGFAERAGDRLYNSSIFAEPSGRRHVYRKCQLYGAYERALFTPGDAPPGLVAYAGLKLGMLICYDVEFPELVRGLALKGADAILVSTAQAESSDALLITEKIVPVRAFENGIAIVNADHAGKDSFCTYAGGTCIVMPDGSDAARAGRTEASVLVADYEPRRYDSWRVANPYLADLRRDLY